MIPPKLSFYEFVRWSAGDFEEEEKASKYWADMWFNEIPKMRHYGDCVKVPMTCNLCLLETLLKDYHTYIFQYEQFIKNNFDE